MAFMDDLRSFSNNEEISQNPDTTRLIIFTDDAAVLAQTDVVLQLLTFSHATTRSSLRS